jgi:hypothetical protein
MTVTITPTVDLTSIPPSVQLAVLDSTGANTALTVQRMDPDGVLRPVRTTDGNALPLTVSGATRVGSVVDYEPWYGQSVYYTTTEVPSVTSVSVTVDEDRIWLTHPGVPSLSMPVELRIGSLDVVEFGVARSVFRPQGRRFPVVQTAGTRYAGASTLIVTMDSTQEWDELQALLDDASTLLLNSSPDNGLNIPTNYISIDTVRLRRPSSVGTDTLRDVELPFDVVDRPAGGTRAAWTMADIRDNFALMSNIRDAFPKMSDIAAGR